MGTVWKNEKQTEFCALLQEMQNAGYTKAAVAGMLGISPAAVTQFFTGAATPKSTTLGLFRHIVDDVLGKKGEPETPREGVPRDTVHRKLEELKERDVKAYETVRETIEVLHDRIVDDVAAAAGKKAVEQIREEEVDAAAKKLLRGGAAERRKSRS